MVSHIHTLKVSLHGSLAATGMGHMTPHSVLLGLMGESPETVQVGRLAKVMDEVGAVGEIELGLQDGTKRVKFDLKRDLVRLRECLRTPVELISRHGTSTPCPLIRTV